MDRQELEMKIIELASTIYDKEESEINVDSRIKEDLGGTSLNMVGLVSEIENELVEVFKQPYKINLIFFLDYLGLGSGLHYF